MVIRASTSFEADTEVVSVADHGAVGDGTTDNLSAFQSAVTEATAKSGWIEVPNGDFGVSAPVELPGWIQMHGSAFSKIKALSAMDYVVGNFNIGVSPYIDQRFKLSRLVVDGNGLATDAISFNRLTATSVIDQVVAQGAISAGWHLIKCQTARFIALRAESNGGPGFHISDCNASEFWAPSAYQNGAQGYLIDSPDFTGGCQFTGLHSELNSQIDTTANSVDIIDIQGTPLAIRGGWIEEGGNSHGVNVVDSVASIRDIRVSGFPADTSKFAIHVGGTSPNVLVDWCMLFRGPAGHVDYGQIAVTASDPSRVVIGRWTDGALNLRDGTSYVTPAAFTGDGATTTFPVNHGLNTTTPRAAVFVDGIEIKDGWSVTPVDADNRTVEFDTAPGIGELITVRFDA